MIRHRRVKTSYFYGLWRTCLLFIGGKYMIEYKNFLCRPKIVYNSDQKPRIKSLILLNLILFLPMLLFELVIFILLGAITVYYMTFEFFIDELKEIDYPEHFLSLIFRLLCFCIGLYQIIKWIYSFYNCFQRTSMESSVICDFIGDFFFKNNGCSHSVWTASF